MDSIVELTSNVINIAGTILEHRSGISTAYAEHVETIYQRSVRFVDDYIEKQSLPVQELRRYLNHDALSPVTIIIGYSELMLMEGQQDGTLPAPYAEALQEIAHYGYAIQEELQDFHAQVWNFMQQMGIPR